MSFKDPFLLKEYKRSWYQANKNRIKESRHTNTKNWRKNNPEKTKEIGKRSDRKRTTDPRKRYTRLVADCKKDNRELNISIEQFVELVNKNCNYCFKSLKEQKGRSLDRIDNNKDYLLDNVLPCCGDCNLIRGNRLTVKEMEIAMKAVLEYRNDKKEVT